MTAVAEPLLRTLVPALRHVERDLRSWMTSPSRLMPLKPLTEATLEGLADDLQRKADDLVSDQPHLVIMLMGGTGVGKSSLLNALAGGAIAQASFTRPTTMDPVVYHHRSIKVDRLDPALRKCRLISHEREELREKVLVDTPDLDSNDLSNRDKLEAVLPVADVVLYVGSQEKYHDRLGWDLFRDQRTRRAFAFVLNKWDRCQAPLAGGLRPDADLVRDLTAEGFLNPLIFRTAAQYWIDRAERNGDMPAPPEGEQFAELKDWLEAGLSRLEIEALKARGVEQLIEHCVPALESVRPPDLTAVAPKTRVVWQKFLDEEAGDLTELLLRTLEPSRQEIEHHFRIHGQQRFHRLMAAYLGFVTWLQFAGSRLNASNWISLPGSSMKTWDLSSFTRDCLKGGAGRGLDQRIKALIDALTVAADGQQFPAEMLPKRLSTAGALDWKGQLEVAVTEALGTVERQWSEPEGTRRWMYSIVSTVANILPELTFIGGIIVLLGRYFLTKDYHPSLFDVFIPLILTLGVLMALHLLIHLLLPLNWPAIRSEFKKQLEQQVGGMLNETFAAIPEQAAAELALERKKIDAMIGGVKDLQGLLANRREAAQIDAMYGRPS